MRTDPAWPPNALHAGLHASEKGLPRVNGIVRTALQDFLINREGYNDDTAELEIERYAQWIDAVALATDPTARFAENRLMRHLLAIDTAIRKRVESSAKLGASDIEAQMRVADPNTATLSQAQWIYLGLTATRLQQWADAAHTPLRRPLEILTAVSDHHVRIAEQSARQRDSARRTAAPVVQPAVQPEVQPAAQSSVQPPSNPAAAAVTPLNPPEANIFAPTRAILDESAVLYYLLEDDLIPSYAPVDKNAPPLAILRAGFTEALRLDTAVQKVMDQMLARPAADALATTVYHDGISLINAAGLAFTDIAGLPEIKAALDTLPVGVDRTACLQRKFATLGESIQQRVGTIGHSLATMRIKLQQYGKLPHIERTESPHQLYRELIEADQQWPAGANFYASPFLVFAMHLAGSAGAVMRPSGWQQQLWSERILPAVRLARTGNTPWPWGSQIKNLLHDAEFAVPSDPEQAARIEQLLFAIRAAKQPAATDLWRGVRTEAMRALRHETLQGDDSRSRQRAYGAYANERLRGTFGKERTFSRTQAVEDYFLRTGLSYQTIHQAHSYSLSTANFNVNRHRYGNLIDEFIARSQAYITARPLYSDHVTVHNTRTTLDALKRRFVEQSASDPVLLARFTEWARTLNNYRAVNPSMVRKVAAESRHQMPSEDRLEFRHNVHLVWEPIPFVGSSYTIYEGIRHRDTGEVISGVVMLGIDALLLLIGGEGEAAEQGAMGDGERAAARSVARAAASGSDRATVDAMQAMDGLHDIELDVFNADGTPHSQRIEVQLHDDPYGIRRPDPKGPQAEVERPGEVAAQLSERTPAGAEQRTGEVGSGRVARPAELAAQQLLGDEVAASETVQLIKSHFNTGASSTPLDNFDAAFDAMYDNEFLDEYARTGLRPAGSEGKPALPPADGPAEAEFDPRSYFREIYRSSPTYRRLFNTQYRETLRLDNAGQDRWEFVGVDKVSQSRTHHGQKVIFIPKSGAEIDVWYMSTEGPRPSTLDRVYHHEAIHALTGMDDPLAEVAIVRRGPVVLLTDQTLSETKTIVPPRLIYSGLPPNTVTAESSEWARLYGPAAQRHFKLENDALHRTFRDSSNRVRRQAVPRIRIARAQNSSSVRR